MKERIWNLMRLGEEKSYQINFFRMRWKTIRQNFFNKPQIGTKSKLHTMYIPLWIQKLSPLHLVTLTSWRYLINKTLYLLHYDVLSRIAIPHCHLYVNSKSNFVISFHNLQFVVLGEKLRQNVVESSHRFMTILLFGPRISYSWFGSQFHKDIQM